jgi:hypothetical protein
MPQAGRSIAFLFGLRASGETLLGWVPLALFGFSGLISVFANLNLFAISVVRCWKDLASFVYLLALAVFMRSF